MIESEGFNSNPTRRSIEFRDPNLMTVVQPNRLHKKNDEVVLVMSETPITDFIRLFNKVGSWIPATPKAELFVTANTWKLLNNVTKCFMIDFMGVLDGLYSNQGISDMYSIKTLKKWPNIYFWFLLSFLKSQESRRECILHISFSNFPSAFI